MLSILMCFLEFAIFVWILGVYIESEQRKIVKNIGQCDFVQLFKVFLVPVSNNQ